LINNYESWAVSENADGVLDFISPKGKKYPQIQPDLKGKYFKKNIPPILEVVEKLIDQNFIIDLNAIRNGLQKITTNTGLKGRWQKIGESPLIICDVGHNEDGINEVLEQLEQMNYQKLHIVFGTVSDKSIDKILSLLPIEACYYFCAANIPRALDANELFAQAIKLGLKGNVYGSVSEAINRAKKDANKDDLIFIGGSTFVVAEIENL
jgi:dihydrofolate synthase / folylpolyglutamate synthase